MGPGIMVLKDLSYKASKVEKITVSVELQPKRQGSEHTSQYDRLLESPPGCTHQFLFMRLLSSYKIPLNRNYSFLIKWVYFKNVIFVLIYGGHALFFISEKTSFKVCNSLVPLHVFFFLTWGHFLLLLERREKGEREREREVGKERKRKTKREKH